MIRHELPPEVQRHPTFDRAKFEELTVGDEALREQLLRLFAGQAAATRQRVMAEAQAGRKQFRDAIHRLKSTCHYVGGTRLLCYLQRSEACLELEQPAVRIATARTIGELVDRLERELVQELDREFPGALPSIAGSFGREAP